MKRRQRIGVRAMRQNLSVYLRRVGSGEVFATPLELLAASGRATLPEGDLLALGPPPRLGRAKRLSAALQDQRAERL